MARILVTGGTGVIGKALVTRLLADGEQVVGLARSEQAAAELAAVGVEVRAGEVYDEDALTEAMAGCELVYNVAGLNAFCIPDTKPMMRANVEGAVAAVKAAKRAGGPAARAHLLGGDDRRGARRGRRRSGRRTAAGTCPTTSAARPRASARRSRPRAPSARTWCSSTPPRCRAPGGPVAPAASCWAFLDGRLKVFVDTYVSLVDIDDCVEGHLLAARRGVSGERYLLSGIGLTITDALALAADVAGVQASPRLAPRALATVGGTAVEYAFKVRGKHPPVCREMVRTLLHGHRYNAARAERELGITYTPARETLEKTVVWAREQGLLQAR